MKRALRWMGQISLGIFLGIPLVGIVVWESLLFSQRPNYEKETKIISLQSEVQIIRDNFGVPHIYATNERDAFVALGYAVAEDRLFQMDILRRLSQGRLSEIIGEDLVSIDKMFRSLRLARWAKEYAESKDKEDPKAWENLDAYLEGVNQFIEEGNLPVEYKLMNFSPEKFQRVDALSSVAYMGFSFAEGIRSDSLHSILEEKYPGLPIKDLFPRYEHEKNASIRENQPPLPKLAGSDSPLENKLFPNRNFKHAGHFQDSSANKMNANAHPSLKKLLVGIHGILDEIPIFQGSNSWVLSGKRTTTGNPILVNDPHIGYSNPGTWMEAHIDTPDLKFYGYFLPGVPFPLLGNTERFAWGLTMLENDDMDLYFETLSEDEKQVLYKNKWVDVEEWEETIHIKGKEPEIYIVRKTPHGTIFSDFITGYEGRPVSLYWAFHEEKNPLMDILYSLLKSNNKNEFRSGVSKIIAPGLNISYVDADDNIAWYGAGRFPIRKKRVDTGKILEGSTGEHDVIGYLPFSQNPQMENPANGIIATANNLPSEKSYSSLGKLQGYWQPADRFRRITEVLSTKEKFEVEDMKALLLDVQAFSAPKIWDRLIHSVNWDDPYWEIIPRRDKDSVKDALEIVSFWDFEAKPESRGATVYYVWCYFTMQNLTKGYMDEDLLGVYSTVADSLNALPFFLENEDHPLWDDPETKTAVETRDGILQKSLVDTVRFLRREVSSSPNSWQWKNLFHVEYIHAVGRKKPLNFLFNVGPFPTMGSYEVVNNVKMNPFQGDFLAKSGPSTRRVVSFPNLDENLSILPIGNSGNLSSPFYKDQEKMYREGMFRKVLFTRPAVEKEKKFTKILQP